VSVHNPRRAIVGLCPSCKGVAVVTNDGEVWDYVTCPCGWGGTTTALVDRVRYERGLVSSIANRTRLRLPDDREAEA
jgi:hypothetical protein